MTIPPSRSARQTATLRSVLLVVALLATGLPTAAQDVNECDEVGEAPDVIVGDLHQVRRWGRVGDISAYSVGTNSCNVGTCWLEWFRGTNHHPVIGGNMFRLKDGRFEQLGQSWLKHGFFALAQELCETGCVDPDDGGAHLGVNCSDPYSANLNGTQTRLGPKWQVNASTGEYPFPPAELDVTGDDIFKRLQVHDADLDPALNLGALYFVEGQYVALDDTAAGNHFNNASWREIVVEDVAGDFELTLTGVTKQQQPAIVAWATLGSGVRLAGADVPFDGRYLVGSKATDLGDGFYEYEYAVQNLNSHRSAATFSVPLRDGSTVQQIGFHDVDYHSGEPYDGTDWPDNGGAGGAVSWATAPFAVNTNANAIRWGTLYNFRFQSDLPPAMGFVKIGLHRPGTPDSVMVDAHVPRVCNEDGTCDAGEDCLTCPGDCADIGPDQDGDGVAVCSDCNDMDASSWSAPSEVRDLRIRHDGRGLATLTWTAPTDPGAVAFTYQTLRSDDAADFSAQALACLAAADPGSETSDDAGTPPAGGAFYYLIRTVNVCAQGAGSPIGENSFGESRAAADCP